MAGLEWARPLRCWSLLEISRLNTQGCPFLLALEGELEGNDFYYEMEEAELLDKISLVFGQMNEPPNRLRVALTGLTLAEKV